MFEKISNLLADYLKVDKAKITRETNIRQDLNADSLVIVELMFTLEDEMGIVIPDDMVEKLTVVGDLADYLEKCKNS